MKIEKSLSYLKKILLKTTLTALIISTISTRSFTNEEINIKINIDNEEVSFSNELGSPFADENQRTQVPLRGALEKIGAEVFWVQDEQKAVILKDTTKVEIILNQNYIMINQEKTEIDTIPVVKNERIYMPIRFVIEALNGSVDWNQESKTVIIKSKEFLEETKNIEESKANEEIPQKEETLEQNTKENETNTNTYLEETAIVNETRNELDNEDKLNKEDEIEENESKQVERNLTNAIISGTYVNARISPSITSQVLTQFDNNQRVKVTYKKGKWYEINLDNQKVYVYDSYVLLDDGIEIETEKLDYEMPTVDNLKTEWSLKYFYTKTLGTDALNEEIHDVAIANGIDPSFVKVLMILESGGNIKTASTPNSRGVYYVGLMQVDSSVGFDNERILNDSKYAIECGIEMIKRKIAAAKQKGNLPTVYEIAWRYNSYNEAGKPYAEKASKLYEELTNKSREELVTIE